MPILVTRRKQSSLEEKDHIIDLRFAPKCSFHEIQKVLKRGFGSILLLGQRGPFATSSASQQEIVDQGGALHHVSVTAGSAQNCPAIEGLQRRKSEESCFAFDDYKSATQMVSDWTCPETLVLL